MAGGPAFAGGPPAPRYSGQARISARASARGRSAQPARARRVRASLPELHNLPDLPELEELADGAADSPAGAIRTTTAVPGVDGCETCGGSGQHPCSACNDFGFLSVVEGVWRTCSLCRGKGFTVCPSCKEVFDAKAAAETEEETEEAV